MTNPPPARRDRTNPNPPSVRQEPMDVDRSLRSRQTLNKKLVSNNVETEETEEKDEVTVESDDEEDFQVNSHTFTPTASGNFQSDASGDEGT